MGEESSSSTYGLRMIYAHCDVGSVRKDAGGIHESVKRLSYTPRKEVYTVSVI